MSVPKRVRDLALEMLRPFIGNRAILLPEEEAFASHLRGNTPLYESLVALITSRIEGRNAQPVPADPIECRGVLERNNELRHLLNRLDLIYRSPVMVADTDEQPA